MACSLVRYGVHTSRFPGTGVSGDEHRGLFGSQPCRQVGTTKGLGPAGSKITATGGLNANDLARPDGDQIDAAEQVARDEALGTLALAGWRRWKGRGRKGTPADATA